MTTGFNVRIATPGDKVAVGALLKASYPILMRGKYDGVVLDRALPLITQANPTLLSSKTFYLVHHEEGDVVGCGGWTRERPGTGEITASLGHIRHFATHPEWIGQGIGRLIYTQCENAARTCGMKTFECYASLNAEGFYTVVGFNAVRPIDIAMGPDLKFPAILMETQI